MFAVEACILFGFLSGFASAQSDYALEFPEHGVTDYVNIWNMRSLTEFTVCLWMKTSTANGTPFSYAPSDALHNEFLIYYPGDFRLFVGNENRPVGVAASDGQWHHICATWSNSEGEWKFYKDGIMESTGHGLKTGYTIEAGGSLILGQEQDTLGGGFNSAQSFKGVLTNVNVWSQVLQESLIMDMSKCCLIGEGNVYKWSDFIYGIKGNPRLMIPAGCPCGV